MQSIFSNALSEAVAKHIDLSADKARDAGVAGAADHAAWNDLPVATGGVCGERGADRLGAAAVLPVLPVRPARWRAGSACGGRSVAAWRQAMGSGDGSDQLGLRQDHDQHPDDLGDLERHGHSADLDAAADGGKLEHAERTELLDRLRAAFPDLKIAALMGDREFIGDAWMAYLHREKIPFILRSAREPVRRARGLRRPADCRHRTASDTGTKNDRQRLLPARAERGSDAPAVRLVVMRLPTGELLALACSGNPRQRWPPIAKGGRSKPCSPI